VEILWPTYSGKIGGILAEVYTLTGRRPTPRPTPRMIPLRDALDLAAIAAAPVPIASRWCQPLDLSTPGWLRRIRRQYDGDYTDSMGF
jgi:hypothetical protein